MPVPRSMQRPAYAAYVCLVLLFAIAATNQIRNVADGLELLLHSKEHVRSPFELDGPELRMTVLQPEAAAAGIEDGDVLMGIGGHPVRGFTDYYAIMRRAQPGEWLSVEAQGATSGSSNVRKDVSIELQPALLASPRAFDWLSFAIAVVAMSWLCLGLGFWVAAVRIRDRQAWLLLALLLCFAEFFGLSGGYTSLYGRESWVQPVFAVYHIVFANLWPATLLLFAVYFPERLNFDRRYPWAKWVVVGPLLFKVITDAITFSFKLHHVSIARELRGMTGFLVDQLSLLQFGALPLFFFIVGYKTLKASAFDVRRRLWLLDVAAAVSVTPIAVWLLVRDRFAFPEWITLLAMVLWFLFPLAMAYGIVVHRAMDVRVVFRQGLGYLLAAGGVRAIQIAISVLIIVGAATMSADRNANLTQRIALITAGFLLLAFTRMFAARLQQWVDRRFFREAYHAEQILGDLANRVRTMVETGPLLETVARRISESLHVPRVGLLLRGGGGFAFAHGVGYSDSASVGIADDSLAVRYLEKEQHVLVHLDDSHSWTQRAGLAERDSLEKLQSELLLPLSLNQKLIGIMSLGPKQSEEPFTKTDIQLLDSVAMQTSLALENSRLTTEVATEVAQRERMNRELEIAREVQERLFPQAVPAIAGIELAGFCRPVLGVGGDYYDYFPLSDGDLGIAVGDVSGKGIPAALLMASLRASLRAETMHGQSNLAALMERLNALVYESSSVSKYATFFYAQYLPQSRLLRYVNAGHEPPLLFRDGSVIRLETGGMVVGLLREAGYDRAPLNSRLVTC